MSELAHFYTLLKEVQKLSAWVLPTAAFTPVIANLAGLSPPWPDSIGLTVCTSLAMIIALLFVFQLFRRKSAGAVNTILLRCLALLVLSAVAYFVLFSLLVYDTPVTGERFVKGFGCTERALAIYQNRCPWLDFRDIKEASYEASVLWTAPSLAMARVTLLALWFALFGICSVLLGTFVSHVSRRGRRKPDGGRP